MVNKYYQKNKEKLQKEARERYQTFSEEGKEKRQKRLGTYMKSFWRRKTEKVWICSGSE